MKGKEQIMGRSAQSRADDGQASVPGGFVARVAAELATLPAPVNGQIV